MSNQSKIKLDVRKDFPVLDVEINGKPLVYLDTAATSQKPLAVIERMDQFLRKENATVRRGLYSLSAKSTKAFDDVRTKVAKFVNASSSDEIIFTRGTTESINLVATCFSRSILNPGDEILISELEHHANIVPWQLAASEWGLCDANLETRAKFSRETIPSTVKVKAIPALDNGELDLAAYEKLVSNGKVKILAITHIANTTGSIIPVKQMIATAHKHGVAVLVDGAQAAQHLKVDVQDLDADFYTFSGHKIYGPTGIGVLYMKRSWAEKLSPYHGGGEMIEKVTCDHTTFGKLPFKYEAGTPPIVEAIGLGAAIDYIGSIGLDAIHAHETELAEYALSELLKIDGLKVLAGTQAGDFQKNKKASLVSFTIDGVEAFDLATLLNEHAIAMRVGHHCAQPVMARYGIVASARISFGIYNDKQDIDAFIKALQSVIRILKS